MWVSGCKQRGVLTLTEVWQGYGALCSFSFTVRTHSVSQKERAGEFCVFSVRVFFPERVVVRNKVAGAQREARHEMVKGDVVVLRLLPGILW